ncbi:hypothetical protein FKP32DRAFT_856568 [Trametes sanguinea]|nr:hypothetical protein FKP32DRAFT_856568 [Trametes sanguinea]
MRRVQGRACAPVRGEERTRGDPAVQGRVEMMGSDSAHLNRQRRRALSLQQRIELRRSETRMHRPERAGERRRERPKTMGKNQLLLLPLLVMTQRRIRRGRARSAPGFYVPDDLRPSTFDARFERAGPQLRHGVRREPESPGGQAHWPAAEVPQQSQRWKPRKRKSAGMAAGWTTSSSSTRGFRREFGIKKTGDHKTANTDRAYGPPPSPHSRPPPRRSFRKPPRRRGRAWTADFDFDSDAARISGMHMHICRCDFRITPVHPSRQTAVAILERTSARAARGRPSPGHAPGALPVHTLHGRIPPVRMYVWWVGAWVGGGDVRGLISRAGVWLY